jgi:poly-gamma-glutamate capsule biosynthesis protein CapA/YwtB (metallophosphatase superfamily)
MVMDYLLKAKPKYFPYLICGFTVLGPAPRILAQSICSEPSAQKLKVNFFGDYFVPHGSQLSPNSLTEVRELIHMADHTVVNLEGTLSGGQGRQFPKAPFALKMTPSSLDFLTQNGIYNVTRANNHAMDYGKKGAEETQRELDARGISHTGVGTNRFEASKPLMLFSAGKPNGLKIAVVAFAHTYPLEAWATHTRFGVNPADPSTIKEAILRARQQADFVVPVFHWGTELSIKAHEYQKKLAKWAIQSGASTVIGHHAHVAQETELMDGVQVSYGLGNFLFFGRITGALQLGKMLTFCKKGDEISLESTFIPLEVVHSGKGYEVKRRSEESLAKVLKTYLVTNKKSLFHQLTHFYLHNENKLINPYLKSVSQSSEPAPIKQAQTGWP